MTKKIKDTPRLSLADKVYEELRTSIVLGELAPGTVLNEGDLIVRFEVSTSPLREALTRLRQDGLIKVIPRKGHVITEISLSDLHDLIQMRLILETAAAELAAPRITDAHVQEMVRLSGTKLIAGDPTSYRQFMLANQNLHELIANLSGNERLARAVRQNFEEVQRVLFSGVDATSSPTEEHDHDEIIGALARRDAVAARHAVIEHIKVSRNRVIDRLLHVTEKLTSTPFNS